MSAHINHVPNTHHNTSFRFMDLPPELRCEIYDYIFYDPLHSPKVTAVDILMAKVPYSSGLRSTSKFIHNETAELYERAEKVYDEKRKAIVGDTVKVLEEKKDELLKQNLRDPLVEAGLAGLGEGEKKTCQHACKSTGCYMCSDPAHRACFDCGKNLAVAVYCKYVNPSVRPPLLLAPSTHTQTLQYTPFGRLFSHFNPANHTRRYDPASKTLYSQSRAFVWWSLLFASQRVVELQCMVRRKAVNIFWAERERSGMKLPFDEYEIRKIESQDKRMGLIDKTRRFVGHGCADWRKVYAARMHEEAKATGVSVEVLIPKRC